MTSSNSVRRAVRHALFISAVTASATAAAYEDKSLDAVVVTGSRIAQPNLETTSPVTQVTSEDITAQGVTRIEDLVTQLPQAFATQNATVANGSTGTATVSLRGLGSARTLVLVDGRRMPYGGVTNSAADLNQIPSALVDRVEVLTGGASAVYGSDAIAGVVNFIMKKNFEGVEVSGQYSFYEHKNDFGGPGAVGLHQTIANRSATNPSQFKLPDNHVTDGYGSQVNVLMGVSTQDGRGNITVYGSYSENDAVLQANRDYSACTLNTTPPTTSFACGGSGTAYPGTFTQDFVTNYTINSAGAGNTFRPFVSATDQYNFGPLNHYLRPDNRYSLGAIGHFELNEHADIYTQLMFTDDRSVAQIAPGGAFFDTSTINCDNPLLSIAQRTNLPTNPTSPGLGCTGAQVLAGDSVPLYIGRRNVEGGGRQQDFHNESFRVVLGTRGAIAPGWDYDLSAQFSRVTTTQLTKNYFEIDRLTRALDVVNYLGTPTCRTALPTDSTNAVAVALRNGNTTVDNNCVPYNPFTIGGVTQAALNYLQAPGLQIGIIDQKVIIGSVTGDLGEIGGKLPTATDSIKVAFGVENRRDSLNNVTDALLTTAGLSGTGGPTIGISGQTNASDIFAEANIPLIQDKAFAEQLSVDMAYRYSDYHNDITTDTYKFGADWAPVEDVRFRGSFQHAVRSANIVELFTAQGFNLFDMVGDPCGAKKRNPNATAAKCIATGVPAANVGSAALDSPAGQFNFLQGGNTALTPEKSDTYSFGIVFTPTFVAGLSLSIDWFNIKIDDTIQTFGQQNTLDACYNNNDAAACGRIHRNTNGQLWVGTGHVVDTNINIGSLETTGIDVNLNYAKLEIGGAGSLSFNFTGTRLIELITDPGAGFEPYDCAGFFSGHCTLLGNGPAPRWRHHARVGWSTPWANFDVALTWRYLSSVTMADSAGFNRIDYVFPHQSYYDLFLNWNATEKLNLHLGINNLLDDDPPINATVGTTGNGNTYPQTYEALGRFIFAGASVKF